MRLDYTNPANLVYDDVHFGIIARFKNRLFLRLQFWGEIQELQNEMNTFSKSVLSMYKRKGLWYCRFTERFLFLLKS